MSIFREYDVRGLADRDLTDQVAWALGRALAERTKKVGDQRAYVGRDVRLSSPRLSAALAAGLEAGGIKVRILAPGPTPLLYFAATSAVKDFPTSTGIMVTGSHNPPEYNGFKMVVAGATLHGHDIQELRGEVESFLPTTPKTLSATSESVDREKDYIDYIHQTIKPCGIERS